MSQRKRFIQRKVTGYRRQSMLSALNSDSENYVVECTYVLLWGLIKYRRSHVLRVPDEHSVQYRKHWDRMIQGDAE